MTAGRGLHVPDPAHAEQATDCVAKLRGLGIAARVGESRESVVLDGDGPRDLHQLLNKLRQQVIDMDKKLAQPPY